jgi:protein CpxP
MIAALLTGGLALAGPFGAVPGDCDGRGYSRGGQLTSDELEERMEHKLEMMSEILDLSDDQEEQIETLLQQQWSSREEHREQRQADRDELRNLLTGDDFNEAEFRALAMEKAQQKVDKMVEHAKLKQQIYQLLSPEQQEKAEKLMAMRGKHGRRHGGHGVGF